MGRQRAGRLLLVLLCCFFTHSFYSQPPLDSLLRKVRYQREDTLKAKLYYDVAVNYYSRDKKLFKTYLDSTLRLSRKINYNKGLGLAYSAYGSYYSAIKDWPNMSSNLQKSDSAYKKAGEYSRIMYNKALYVSYYKQQGDFDKALKLDLEILHFYEQNGPKSDEARLLGNIAIILQQMERYKEAADYYKRAFRIQKANKDISGESISLLNLGGMLAEQEMYTKAEPYLEESLRLQKTLKQEIPIITCQANLAHVYAETGRPVKALELIEKCKVFYEENEDTLNLIKATLYESIAYMKLKKFNKALSVLNAKHAWTKNNSAYSELEEDILWQYYNVYKAMGKTDIALRYFEKAKDVEDHNQNMRIQHGVSRMKEHFETTKKQQENEQLRKDNELKDLQISQRNYFIYGSILLVILICVIAFTTIRYNRLKNEKIAVEMEQRLLQTQMNPHFIFNVLHAIHTYMLRKDTDESGKLLTSFARLVRSILQHSATDNIPLAEELSWLKDYIRLQQLRFTDSFDYTIEIDEEISPENLLLPPMLIQPFIENAIEHGFSDLGRTGKLTISYRKMGKEVEIRITDNGKGFSDDNRSTKEHESAAVQITEKRIILLNKRRKGAFTFKITSRPNEGTVVYFSIPYLTLFD